MRCHEDTLRVSAGGGRRGLGQDSRNTGWIVIPVSEYGALRARAFPVKRAPEAPPLDATLTRVDYELRVYGDIASELRHPALGHAF